MRIGIICGGPSAERGISLNSARSAMDHLLPLGWEIIPFYCDHSLNFYRLLPYQLYSNTPSDFDFKLAHTAQLLSEEEFVKMCQTDTDIILPLIHGAFGEDGSLQDLLEKYDIPFIGSTAASCRLMFDKVIANQHMETNGYETLPNCNVDQTEKVQDRLVKITEFFKRHDLTKVVVKPSAGGSSLGVATASTPEQAMARIEEIFTQNHGTKALVEPYCHGREFTVVVLQNPLGQPVALIPTEIELIGGDLFTFRHKYLPTCHVEYHCPPRFSDKVIAEIQKYAENLFSFFEMRDFARIDGWLMEDGKLIFSDFNPLSGMEQNSYLFIQASRVGLSHSELLHYIVSHRAKNYGLDCSVNPVVKSPTAMGVRVLFGGGTAERQVSLMSGTNVWLKLLYSENYLPSPYILGPNDVVWHLPYSFTLNHTVEEILTRCEEAQDIISRLKALVPSIRQRLRLNFLESDSYWLPRPMTLDQFCQEAVEEDDFVFIALHGGHGEDGTLQAKLDQYQLSYNGSDFEASRLCMDKAATGQVIRELNDKLLISAEKLVVTLKDAKNSYLIWTEALQKFETDHLLIKPQNEGCSAGVVRLNSDHELKIYLERISARQHLLPPNTLTFQTGTLELPLHIENFILEPFIITDDIRTQGLKLIHRPKQGWIELTVGVLEENGRTHALTPSITVVQGNVLSLEEKFQGGTGVNLTPPPTDIISERQINLVKTKIEQAAKALGIQGYARIDIFFNIRSDQTMIIEANSLPGLTPSTVIYHQALAETPPLTPQLFLSKLIEFGLQRRALGHLIPLSSK